MLSAAPLLAPCLPPPLCCQQRPGRRAPPHHHHSPRRPPHRLPGAILHAPLLPGRPGCAPSTPPALLPPHPCLLQCRRSATRATHPPLSSSCCLLAFSPPPCSPPSRVPSPPSPSLLIPSPSLPSRYPPSHTPHTRRPPPRLQPLPFASRPLPAGYNVVLLNYRGSTGFGEASIQSLPGKIGASDVADCLASLQAAVDAGGSRVWAPAASGCLRGWGACDVCGGFGQGPGASLHQPRGRPAAAPAPCPPACGSGGGSSVRRRPAPPMPRRDPAHTHTPSWLPGWLAACLGRILSTCRLGGPAASGGDWRLPRRLPHRPPGGPAPRPLQVRRAAQPGVRHLAHDSRWVGGVGGWVGGVEPGGGVARVGAKGRHTESDRRRGSAVRGLAGGGAALTLVVGGRRARRQLSWQPTPPSPPPSPPLPAQSATSPTGATWRRGAAPRGGAARGRAPPPRTCSASPRSHPSRMWTRWVCGGLCGV